MGEAASALENPTLPAHPAVALLTVTGSPGYPGPSGTTKLCHAVLVDEHWALTAAHCFAFRDPSVGNPTPAELFGQSVGEAEVVFHPRAWDDGATSWTSPRFIAGLHDAWDLALVYLPQAVAGIAPAKLWRPAAYGDPALDDGGQPAVPSLGAGAFPPKGISAHVTGLHGSGTAFITGSAPAYVVLDEAQDYTNYDGRLLYAAGGDNGPPSSQLESQDHGGGLFITAFKDSTPFAMSCAPTPGDTGEEVLVGIGHTSDWFNQPTLYNDYLPGGPNRVNDNWVPVYDPDHVDWIAQTISDSDQDGVCDDVDSCIGEVNLGTNCNQLAEAHPVEWRSNGALVDDACDPAPCPDPSLAYTHFEPGTPIDPFHDHGRAIHDRLEVRPVLVNQPSLVAGHALPLFCMCRDEDGKPVTSPIDCAAAPSWCLLNPEQDDYQEVGGGDPPVSGQTYWHPISIDYGHNVGIVKGDALPMHYPGATVARAWAYESDYQFWLGQNWVTPLPQSPGDALYPPGTDLAGAFWTHDDTNAGAFGPEHEVAPCVPGDPLSHCSIADGFTYGVMPDPRVGRATGFALPELRPDPWWTYCAACGDLYRFPVESTRSAPFVTLDPTTLEPSVWVASGGYLTDAIALALRQRLADPAFVFLGASEPVAFTASPALPRAVALAASGQSVAGAVTRSASGFDFAVQPPFVGKSPAARSGFARAYSRTSGYAFVAGGRDGGGDPLADVWSWNVLGAYWRIAHVSPAELTPTNALAATFSHRDWRLWLVDETPFGRRLVRLDPFTGNVYSYASLPLLDGLSSTLWLRTTEDGRVLLAANSSSFTLALLEADPFVPDAPVTVTSVLHVPGTLVAAPVVQGGVVSLAVDVDLGGGMHAVRVDMVTLDELAGLADGGKVALCHVPPGNPANAHTLSVGEPAASAHLGHGDYLGPCH